MATNWDDFQLETSAPVQKPGQGAGTDWSQFELVPQGEPTPKGVTGHLRDAGISLLQGAIGVPEAAVGLADIATGGQAGKFLENEGGPFGFRPKQAREFLDTLKTDTTQQQKKEFEQSDGIVGKTAYALQNPSLVANAVVESAPMMGFGGVVGRGVIAAAPKVGAAMAGAVGEGVAAAGSSAEKIRQETADGTLTAGQSGLAAAAGVATAGFGALGAKVAQRLGIADADTLMVQGAKGLTGQAAQQAAVKGIPRKVIEGAIAEGFLEELPQSVSEQVLQNIALNKDWSEGVDSAVVLGVLSGMAMGGGAAGLQGASQSRAAAGVPQETPAAETPLLALPAPTYTGTPSDQILQAEAERANAAAQAEARAAGIYQQRAEFDAARQGEPAAPVANPGLELVRQAYAAQLDAIQQQEQGDPAVAQSTPPDGRAVLDAQAAQAQADREAVLAASRGMASPDDEIFQSTGAMEQPHRVLGIDPAAGPLSAGAAIAVDTGVAGQMQAAAQTGNLAGATQMAAGGPSPATPQAQAANPAGLAWNGMSPTKRAEVAGTIPGLPQVVARNVPNAGWESINPELQGRIASAMASNQPQQAAIPAPAADMTGGQIDKEWSAFAPESGTLAVPRAEMPQIKAEHRGAMTNFMNARGVSHAAEEVPADSLRPTQAEFSPGKVKKAMGFTGGDRSILISADNYVLDGHHQWLAKREAGEPVKVIRLNAPIADLIPLAREFPSSTTAGSSASEVVTNPATLVEKSPQNAQIQPETRAATGMAGGGQNGEQGAPIRDGAGGQYAAGRAAASADDLRAMAQDAGWQEVGGKMVRDAAGNISRTKWMPRAEWFRAGMEGDPSRLAQDIARFVSGQNVPVKSRRTIEGMLDWLDAQRGTATLDEDASMYDFEVAFGDAALSADENEVAEFFDEAFDAQPGQTAADIERALGFTEEEISNAARENQEGARGAGQAQSGAAPAAGQRADEAGTAQAGARREGSHEGLTSYTNEDIARQEAEQKARSEADSAAQRAADQKAQADAERGSFTLTGSDRAADVMAAQGQGGLFEATQEAGTGYTVEERKKAKRDDYTQDLFGNAVPDTLGGAGVGQQSASAENRNLLAASSVPGAVFATVTGARQTGELKTAFPVVDAASKAAHTFAGLRKRTTEHFAVLVLNTKGEPIAYSEMFSGGTSATSVYPDAVAKFVYGTPGAASFWVSHNHPSGSPTPSNADLQLTKVLSKAYGQGTGIEMAGHVVIAGGKASLIARDGAIEEQGFAIPAMPRRNTIPIMRRDILRLGTFSDSIASPAAAKVAVRVLSGKESGVVFLNAQNAPVAFLPMSQATMVRLRDGKSARELFGAAAKSNASAAMIHLGAQHSRAELEAASQNLHDALSGAGDIRILDAFLDEGDKMYSLAESSEISGSGRGVFMSRAEPHSDAPKTITAESLPEIFAERFPKLAGAIKTMLDRGTLGQKGGLVVLDSNDEAQIAREFADRTGRSFDDTVQLFAGAGGDINAFYDPESGLTFMVGPNLSAESLPAVVLHEMVHGQQRQALDQKALALIEGRGKEAPALRAFLDRVSERMEVVGETGNPFEATSYIVEMAVQEGQQAGFSAADGPILAWIERNIGKPVADLVRGFAAMVRAWALSYGVTLKSIAVDDLVAYAKAGVREAARGNVVTNGKAAPAPAFSRGAPEGTGVGRVAERLRDAAANAAGRRRPDLSDPFSAENTRLREQDKSLWQKAKGQLRRWLAPGGLLPETVFAEKIKRDSEFQAVEFDIRHIVGGFEQAVKQDFGVHFDKLSRAQQRTLSEALAGKVAGNLPQATKTAVVAMRQYIDTLSGEYLQIIQGRIDALMARAQQTGNVGAASQAINEIELYEKIRNNVGAYVHRSYQAFDDPKWFQKVPTATLNAARQYLKDGYMEGGKTSEAEALLLTEVALNEILKNGTAYDSMEAFISEGKLGAKDLSVLMRRKDVPPVIRALLGEYTDPRLNFTKSATKMGRLIWNQRFLDRVRDMGMGTFLFEGKDRPPMATTQIAAQGSEVYAPLNGLWTFPEVAQAFKDALGKEQMGDLYRFIVRANGLVKYGKTVLSPTTAMRNWQSAMFFAMANGHFDLTQMKKSVAAFREQVRQNATGGDLAYLRHLKELGVVYDTPYAGEMMRFIEDAKADNGVDTVMRAFGASDGTIAKGLRGVKQINQVAQGFYSFGDDFWKIIGFENEKAGLLKAGLPLAEAEREAAKRIRDTYPTYSMVGAGIQKLSRFPLMGTFVSFPAEIVRTSANMLRTTAADLKSDNPALRALGMKRAVGMAVVSGLFYALAALSKSASGVDDDEEEALRDLAPEWQKNSTFLFAGRNEKGQLRYFDMSFLDPYGYWKRPITAMLRDQPWEKSAASALKDMLTPFFGADIATAAIFQAVANKKDSGGKVYQEGADAIDQAGAIANHLRKALQPGFVGNIERLTLAAQGVRREGSGQPYDLNDEMTALLGWRASTMDPKTALYYRSFEFNDAMTEAKQVLTRTLRSVNPVSQEDIRDARGVAQSRQAEAFTEMRRLVQAAQAAGMNPMQIRQVLKQSSISQANAEALMRGTPPRLVLTVPAVAKAVQQARAMEGPEFAQEVARRYRMASGM